MAKELLVVSVLNVALLMLGQWLQQPIIVLISVCVFGATIVRGRGELLLPLLLFYLPWAPMMKLSPDGYTFYTLGFCALLAVWRVPTRHLVVCCLFIGYLLAVKTLRGDGLTYGFVVFCCVALLLPLYVAQYRARLSLVVTAYYTVSGVTMASVLAQLFAATPHMARYIEVTTWQQFQLTRFAGFYGDANFYALHILCAIGLLLVVLTSRPIAEQIVGGAVLLGLVYVGLLSVSKMFVVLLCAVTIVWLVVMLRSQLVWERKMLLLGIVLVVCVSSVLLFGEQLHMYTVRFQLADGLDGLTTGRSGIFSSYVAYFTQQPLALMFGQGFAEGPLRSAAHNTFVQLLYQFGIVGLLFFMLWLSSFRFAWKGPSVAVLAVVCLGPWLALDLLFADEFFLLLALCCVGEGEWVT